MCHDARFYEHLPRVSLWSKWLRIAKLPRSPIFWQWLKWLKKCSYELAYKTDLKWEVFWVFFKHCVIKLPFNTFFLWSSGFVLLACNQSLELGNSSNWSLMVSNFLIIQLALFQFQFRRQWKPLFSAEQSGTNSRGIFFRQSILVKETWMNLDTRVQ